MYLSNEVTCIWNTGVSLRNEGYDTSGLEYERVDSFSPERPVNHPQGLESRYNDKPFVGVTRVTHHFETAFFPSRSSASLLTTLAN